MDTKQRINLLKKSINNDMDKISRLIQRLARKNGETDEFFLLVKLLYDTRRNIESKIHDFEKRMCY